MKKANSIIAKLIASGYKTQIRRGDVSLIEVIKDKWVYAKDSQGNDYMLDVDVILSEHDSREEKRKELLLAAKGRPAVVQYFEKYGVLGERVDDQTSSFSSLIIHDGKYIDSDLWNTELYTYMIQVLDDRDTNNYYTKTGYVFSTGVALYSTVDNLVEGKIIDNEPTIRECHRDGRKLHECMTNHVNHKDWLADIEKAFDIFIEKVDSLIVDEHILLNKKKGFMLCQQIPNEIFRWEIDTSEKHGWKSCPRISFKRHQLLDNGKKYRDGEEFIKYTVPEFDSYITKSKLIQDIREAFIIHVHTSGAMNQFKY